MQYVEEPVSDLVDLAAFHCTTGVPVALDESVDEAMRGGADGARDGDGDDDDDSTGSLNALIELFEPSNGVVAIVLKPSVIGGFERCARAAAAARSRGVASVVTTAFDAGVGADACANLARALDAAAAKAAADASAAAAAADDDDDDDASGGGGDDDDGWDAAAARVGVGVAAADREPSLVARLAPMRHGLGTGEWLDGDVFDPPAAPLDFSSASAGGGVRVALAPAAASARRKTTAAVSEMNTTTTTTTTTAWGAESVYEAKTSRGTYSIRVVDSGGGGGDARPPVLLLHGFLGGAEDWHAIASGLSRSHRVVAIDLPGHGGSALTPLEEEDDEEKDDDDDDDDDDGGKVLKERRSPRERDRMGTSVDGRSKYDVESVSDAVAALIPALGASKAIVVGYSLGARIALHLAATRPDVVHAVASIGGSGGIVDSIDRATRAARDDAAAAALRDGGVAPFATAWYAQPLFRALSTHPRWRGGKIAAARARNSGDARELADVLRGMSPGRQPAVTGRDVRDVARAGGALFVAGGEDVKFTAIARALARECGDGDDRDTSSRVEVVVVPGAGHAVHLEAPEALIRALTTFVATATARAAISAAGATDDAKGGKKTRARRYGGARAGNATPRDDAK